ncbi:sigma-70 family RNA polymerase sigma factor, partial [Rubinisphaera sp. JC750]|uniref:sigma-70 family RNA polymerase sigma factor n=1 Tax=Rubinisphaera sp. JC750 TaxID=2898658 RepID=UPI001F01E678
SYYNETRLIQKAQAGCVESRNEVWARNVRLVYSVVNRFSLPRDLLADAIQDGALGLKRAIEKYDVEKYTAFSTYAWYWVYQRIQRFVQTHRGRVSVPNHLYKDYCKFRYEFYKNRTPQAVETVIYNWRKRDASVFDRLFSLHLLNTARSLDRCPEIFELPASEEDYDFRIDLEQNLSHALTRLNERERQIVERRFGLYGEPEETLEEVGKRFGVTRERIRQLEARALAKLEKILAPHQYDFEEGVDDDTEDSSDAEFDAEDWAGTRTEFPPVGELLLAHFSTYPFRQANALIHYYGLAGERAAPLHEVASLLELSERKTALALKHGTKKLLEFTDSHYHPQIAKLTQRIKSDQDWRDVL